MIANLFFSERFVSAKNRDGETTPSNVERDQLINEPDSQFFMLSYQIVFLRDMTDLTHNKKVFSLKHIKTNLLLTEISIQPTYFTWLSDNDPTSINRLEGYDRFACANRVNTPGGGVGASSKNDFNFYRFLLAVELMNLIIKMFK